MDHSMRSKNTPWLAINFIYRNSSFFFFINTNQAILIVLMYMLYRMLFSFCLLKHTYFYKGSELFFSLSEDLYVKHKPLSKEPKEHFNDRFPYHSDDMLHIAYF